MSGRQGGKLKPLKAPKKDKSDEDDEDKAFKARHIRTIITPFADRMNPLARDKAAKGGPPGGGIKKSGKK
ncbi:translation machinery associated TMA7 [Auricularia subglabra TFB-10046 SS5]|nr:translation machinery associated TMA7 [Auricularia subglabra TFB-10046 SS5]